MSLVRSLLSSGPMSSIRVSMFRVRVQVKARVRVRVRLGYVMMINGMYI